MQNKTALFLIIAAAFFITFACACGPIEDLRILDFSDVHPPVFLDLETKDGSTVILTFSKPAEIITASITPSLPLVEWSGEDNSITLSFCEPQVSGREYVLAISVKDEKKNTMDLITRFYGYNPDVPGLLINEFTTQGSASHPDLVELYVTSPGNMAGVVFFQGTKKRWEDKMVFPSLWVEKGDYILIHCKPQGTPSEIDETTHTAESGGLDASPLAWDFWLKGGTGLSGNNGALTVYANPHGDILDAVLYSNRTSASDENYRGFGSTATMEKADELVEAGAWVIALDAAAPEDAVNPDKSTATRSMCRSGNSEDTNSKDDWHIVPTGKYSFGRQNSDEVYVPK